MSTKDQSKTTGSKATPAKEATEQPATKTASVKEAAQLVASIDQFEETYRDAIAAKMSAGLTREQAITCIKEQIKFDAAEG